MKRILSLSMILFLLCGFIRVNAARIFYVNATQFNVSLVVAYLDTEHCSDYGFTVSLISGQIYERDPGRCRLHSIRAVIHTPSGDVLVRIDPTDVNRGMFAIRPRGNNYEIIGPKQEAGLGRGRVYLVNATGHEVRFFVDYPNFVCRSDSGDLVNGGVADLHIGTCITSIFRGTVRTEHGSIVVEGGASTNNGTFVFRRRSPTAGNNSPFEVVGPFKE